MTEFLGFGPGSQPVDEDGGVLEFMELPKAMATYRAPALPEPEQVADLAAAKAILWAVAADLKSWQPGTSITHDLTHLSRKEAAFVSDVLGDGEVSVIGGAHLQAQESVMAGVWRVRETDADGAILGDRIEIGVFPPSIEAITFRGSRSAIDIPPAFAPGVFNAPPLLVEINEAIARSGPDSADNHSINLSLLPHTEEDLTLLDTLLGKGPVTVLSRGYGNCRVMATGLRHTWWVRFYNSQDTVILNQIEISMLPDVVVASAEDIADSAVRLEEIMAVYA